MPLLSLLPALQFCAPMANPKASSCSSLFSQLPEEPSVLMQDLSKLELSWAPSVPVLGLCWSPSSLGVGARGWQPPPALPGPPLGGGYFLTRYHLC